MPNKIVVLVNSHDRYSAAWPVFCHSMKKYWPDCPWPIKFITNQKTAPCGKSLKVGKDEGWGVSVLRALKMIRAPVILWMLEDVWLTERPDAKALKDFGRIVLRGGADHIRLISSWKKTVRSKGAFKPDPRLMIFADKSMYKTALVPGFWNVETFRRLIRVRDTAWRFEQAGKRRTQHEQYHDRFLCVKEHKYLRFIWNTKDDTYISPFESPPITRGKWRKSARWYAKREGLRVDFSRHPDGTRRRGPLK